MVLLDVSVTRADGGPVPGLSAEDFVVREDGVPREVSFFRGLSETSPTPLSAVLLIDASSSMEGTPMEGAREAASSFVHESPENTEIAILSFDGDTRLLSDGFTRDRAALASALDGLRPGGGTALYDALLEAERLFEKARNPRRAIVLSSDGCDLDSRARFEELEQRLASSEASLYAVGQYRDSSRDLYLTGKKYFKPPSLDENLNPVWVLRHLAELTGGRAFFPRQGEPTAPTFQDIARELSHQYLLGFDPGTEGQENENQGEEETGVPRFRRLEVELRSPPGGAGSYVVRARRGYVR
jgi:Ca-activated chloride channel family protein